MSDESTLIPSVAQTHGDPRIRGWWAIGAHSGWRGRETDVLLTVRAGSALLLPSRWGPTCCACKHFLVVIR
jgi:hypothetical protein